MSAKNDQEFFVKIGVKYCTFYIMLAMVFNKSRNMSMLIHMVYVGCSSGYRTKKKAFVISPHNNRVVH